MSILTSTSSLRALPGRLRRWVVAGVLAGSVFTPVFGNLRAADEMLPAGTRPQPGLREDLLDRLGVTRWHAAGVRGSGRKVAVLDSGSRAYRTFLRSSMPAAATARTCR